VSAVLAAARRAVRRFSAGRYCARRRAGKKSARNGAEHATNGSRPGTSGAPGGPGCCSRVVPNAIRGATVTRERADAETGQPPAFSTRFRRPVVAR